MASRAPSVINRRSVGRACHDTSRRMSRCRSTQSGTTAPEHRKWRRIHGLQPPLHPQQVAGWLALVFFATASFLVLVPAFSVSFQPLLAAVLVTLFALHSVAHLTALLLDPADPELRRLRMATVPEFDRSKHAHVIENGRCHLCNIETSGPGTKHCSVCNKCVGRFDHHCKWLNHCIGGRNYAAFLVCVVSAVSACLVIVGISVTELVFYHIDPSWLAYPRTADHALPHEVFLIIVGSVGTLAAVAAGLLLHLCLFHVYISILGITTYEYIRNYRRMSSVTNRHVLQKDIRREVSVRKQEIPSDSDKEWKCWNRQGFERALPNIETGDKKCSVETVEGALNRGLQNDPRHCFSLADGETFRTSRQNGFIGANYPKASPAVSVVTDRTCKRNGGAEAPRVCHGCRYCSKRKDSSENVSGRGFFSGMCGEGDVRSVEISGRRCEGGQSPTNPIPRRNRVRPTDSGSSPPRRSASLPALPPPVRRQVQSVSLKELGDALAYAQAQRPARSQNFPPTISRRAPPRRNLRRKSIPALRPTMSPTLSPIHESGLSDPGTPQPAPRPRRGVWLPEQNRT